jgi:DDE superfamily endonuclease
LPWLLIRQHVLDADDVVVMSGDHVVVTKAGKTTYGLDRFFASLYGQTVSGLCFLSLSLFSVKRRTSHPVLIEQVATTSEASVQAPPQQKCRGQRGRPKGSKNRHRRKVEISPSLSFIQEHIKRLLEQIGDVGKVVYFIFDGELGHNDAMQMVQQVGLIGKYLSSLGKLDNIVTPEEGFETQLCASCLPIPFGVCALGMTRQRRDGRFQCGIEPRHVPALQGPPNVA